MKLSSRSGGVRTAALLLLPVFLFAAAPAAEDKAKEKTGPLSPAPSLEWRIYRGDRARSNRGIGGPPVLEALCRDSLLVGKERFLDWLFQIDDLGHRAVGNRLLKAEQILQKRGEPIIPAGSPIALTAQSRGEKRPLLVYKNYAGVVAVNPRDGSLAWQSPSLWSLQRMSTSTRSGGTLEQWLNVYERHYPQILFENSASGTLSTDGEFVYVIDDLAIPPPPTAPAPPAQGFVVPPPASPRRIDFRHVQVRGEQPPGLENPYDPPSQAAFRLHRRRGQLPDQESPYDLWPPPQNDLMRRELDKETEDAIQHNRLFALSLAKTGALTWALGEDGPLNDCYFLGPPLPLNGLLYLLIQRKQQVSLVCIDPRLGKQHFPQPKIVFTKPLVEVRTSLLADPVRRIQASHLAYREGILVCPTNAGVVLGVDLLLNRLAWAYPYRQKNEKAKDPPAPALPRHWKTTAPVLAEGKVVFAPPDSPVLHCLNLKDGSLLWSRKKNRDDVYLAGVYDSKVLIVGTNSVQALSLSKGKHLWTQETGMPSGQGIAAGNEYYLPLQRGAQSKQPEILVLDLSKGQVIAHHKMPKRNAKGDELELPGNLLFVENKLISLTPWEIVAYPLRGGK